VQAGPAIGAALAFGLFAHWRRLGLGLGRRLGLALLRLFETQQQLICRQRLGAASKAMALHVLDDLSQTLRPDALGDQYRLQRLGIIGKRFDGQRHDHWTPYLRLDVEHAFCNAHLLRELAAVIEFDDESWAEAMRKLLLDANDAVRQAKQASLSALHPQQIRAFERRYWSAVRQGLALHRKLPKIEGSPKARGRQKKRPGHNLLLRFKAHKNATLRILTDFDVPFTNNLAEQDRRMMKVKMKISGGFRTLEGAIEFARLRSIISSARKHGLNILQTLTAPSAEILTALHF
jgi:transposase